MPIPNLPYMSPLSPETMQQDNQYSALNPNTYNQIFGSSMTPGAQPQSIMANRRRAGSMGRQPDMSRFNIPHPLGLSGGMPHAPSSPFNLQSIAALLKQRNNPPHG